jgi:hypothetical protein
MIVNPARHHGARIFPAGRVSGKFVHPTHGVLPMPAARPPTVTADAALFVSLPDAIAFVAERGGGTVYMADPDWTPAALRAVQPPPALRVTLAVRPAVAEGR